MRFTPPFLDPEMIFRASRSGGKGGQNVNKLSTKVQVTFNPGSSKLLTEEEKAVIMEKLAEKLSAEGTLQATSQAERTQAGNKAIALRKMYALLNKCFVVRKKRKATRPGKGAVEKRLQNKKRNSETKRMRRNDF